MQFLLSTARKFRLFVVRSRNILFETAANEQSAKTRTISLHDGSAETESRSRWQETHRLALMLCPIGVADKLNIFKLEILREKR
jgi:hypothetical protein